MRYLKIYWRAIIGVSLMISGASYLEVNSMSAIVTMFLGAGFIISHMWWLFHRQEHSGSRKNSKIN